MNSKQEITKKLQDEALENISIRRFASAEELREVLKESEVPTRGMYYNDIEELATDSAQSENVKSSTRAINDYDTKNDDTLDYSKTNNQVENVDEADIVKTDGKYIYYTQNSRVYIVDSEDLSLKSTIKESHFSPSQIFINGDKLVVFGISYGDIDMIVTTETSEETDAIVKEEIDTIPRTKTLARIYDISNKENPEFKREISIDGYYQDARMIENNIYFITQCDLYLYKALNELQDSEILPTYRDSSVSEERKIIAATDIAYFENSQSHSYSLVAGFNVNSNEQVNIETFFGAGQNIYVSENNMYIVSRNYTNFWTTEDSTIYKFQLKNAKIVAIADCKVDGYVNNQFSIDEYEGNLRVATTSMNANFLEDEYEAKYVSHLTIFNEKLERIGSIENLVEDEEIYSVRFMGKVGYIVTFRQIDPLWVIDLSDPTNPVIKGELEIPGYSSYLHPYDETHIIGIGYNVKDNGYGGVTRDTMKISMFDVSDLENPKEIFHISFGSKYMYSNIGYEHKALFFKKSDNLIGFPVNWYDRVNKTGLILYRVDLENNRFEEILDLVQKGYGYVQRALYIENHIYALYGDRILKYDLNTFEEINRLDLSKDY